MEQQQRKRRRSFRRLLREITETLALALIIYFVVRAVVLPYEVEGASMDPSLRNGERLFVNRTAYTQVDVNQLWNLLPWEDREGTHIIYSFDPPERGDIIVLNPPTASDKPYIKRVIGLPGETISFVDGYVYIDGRRLHETYVGNPETTCNGGGNCRLTVPADHVFVLGDNRNNSADSREFGPVSYDRIIGKAIFSNWPLDTFGPVRHPDYGE